jgi:hypothetical protein
LGKSGFLGFGTVEGWTVAGNLPSVPTHCQLFVGVDTSRFTRLTDSGSARRSYEEKERDPKLLEKEKERAATQRAERNQASAARTDSTRRARRQAAGYFHEVGTQRLVKEERRPEWTGVLISN